MVKKKLREPDTFTLPLPGCSRIRLPNRIEPQLIPDDLQTQPDDNSTYDEVVSVCEEADLHAGSGLEIYCFLLWFYAITRMPRPVTKEAAMHLFSRIKGSSHIDSRTSAVIPRLLLAMKIALFLRLDSRQAGNTDSFEACMRDGGFVISDLAACIRRNVIRDPIKMRAVLNNICAEYKATGVPVNRSRVSEIANLIDTPADSSSSDDEAPSQRPRVPSTPPRPASDGPAQPPRPAAERPTGPAHPSTPTRQQRPKCVIDGIRNGQYRTRHENGKRREFLTREEIIAKYRNGLKEIERHNAMPSTPVTPAADAAASSSPVSSASTESPGASTASTASTDAISEEDDEDVHCDDCNGELDADSYECFKCNTSYHKRCMSATKCKDGDDLVCDLCYDGWWSKIEAHEALEDKLRPGEEFPSCFQCEKEIECDDESFRVCGTCSRKCHRGCGEYVERNSVMFCTDCWQKDRSACESFADTIQCTCPQSQSHEGRQTIQCDGPCGQWYHALCNGLTDQDATARIEQFFCSSCQTLEQETTWRCLFCPSTKTPGLFLLCEWCAGDRETVFRQRSRLAPLSQLECELCLRVTKVINVSVCSRSECIHKRELLRDNTLEDVLLSGELSGRKRTPEHIQKRDELYQSLRKRPSKASKTVRRINLEVNSKGKLLAADEDSDGECEWQPGPLGDDEVLDVDEVVEENKLLRDRVKQLEEQLMGIVQPKVCRGAAPRKKQKCL